MNYLFYLLVLLLLQDCSLIDVKSVDAYGSTAANHESIVLLRLSAEVNGKLMDVSMPPIRGGYGNVYQVVLSGAAAGGNRKIIYPRSELTHALSEQTRAQGWIYFYAVPGKYDLEISTYKYVRKLLSSTKRFTLEVTEQDAVVYAGSIITECGPHQEGVFPECAPPPAPIDETAAAQTIAEKLIGKSRAFVVRPLQLLDATVTESDAIDYEQKLREPPSARVENKYLEPKKFDINPFLAEGQIPQIRVQALTKDAAKLSYRSQLGANMLGSVAVGAMGTSLVFLGYAGSGVVGAGILIPPLIVSGIESSLDRATAEAALKQIDMFGAIKQKIEKAVDPGLTKTPSASVTVEVLLGRCGIITPQWSAISPFSVYEDLYFNCNGLLRVFNNEAIVYSDAIIWNEKIRNTDLPAPRRASLHQLTRNDAALLKETFLEAEEVIAAATLKRLKLGH